MKILFQIVCSPSQGRTARQTNDTLYNWSEDSVTAAVQEDGAWDQPQGAGVVAQGGKAGCGGGNGRVPLELEMVVGSRDVLSADTLVHADHRVPGKYACINGSFSHLLHIWSM